MSDAATILLVAVGILLSGGVVLWRTRRPPLASLSKDGTQEITLVAHEGYKPARFRARLGVPLHIHFERRDDEPCGNRVFFPDFRIERPLHPLASTTVELTPNRYGEFLFTCENGIYYGALMVSPGLLVSLQDLFRRR
jgi:plastocyanin domain-containing protein